MKTTVIEMIGESQQSPDTLEKKVEELFRKQFAVFPIELVSSRKECNEDGSEVLRMEYERNNFRLHTTDHLLIMCVKKDSEHRVSIFSTAQDGFLTKVGYGAHTELARRAEGIFSKLGYSTLNVHTEN